MDFEPIIKHKKKSTLKDKRVAIEGNDAFGREEVHQLTPSKDEITTPTIKPARIPKTVTRKKAASKTENTTDFRYKATLTQRISPEVNLKVQMLRPFLESLDKLDNASFNNLVSVLIDYYADHELISRQRNAFHSMVNTQLSMLKQK